MTNKASADKIPGKEWKSGDGKEINDKAWNLAKIRKPKSYWQLHDGEVEEIHVVADIVMTAQEVPPMAYKGDP